MSPLKEILNNFQPISLEEMDNVKLMERTDTKYIFPYADLPQVLGEMMPNYRLLEIGGIRTHRYESLYFDTPEFHLYLKHQSGKLNRHKIRFRRYVDTGGKIYFEIKFKNNKERTIKKRVKMMESVFEIRDSADQLLQEITPFDASMFQPKLWTNYTRMTFVNKFSQERLTIDTNLHYIKEDKNAPELAVHFPQLVIAEAKRDKTAFSSPFIRTMRNRLIREGGISKYCFGIYHLFDSVKKNRFKQRVRAIQKTTQFIKSQTGT